MTTTRAEHLRWCKDRAIAEYDYDDGASHGVRAGRAISSMTSDLGKHPGTAASSVFAALGTELLVSGNMPDRESVVRWIEGYN